MTGLWSSDGAGCEGCEGVRVSEEGGRSRDWESDPNRSWQRGDVLTEEKADCSSWERAWERSEKAQLGWLSKMV